MFTPPRKLHPYCRSERDTANKHTAQRSACSAEAALDIINSLCAPNHGPLFSALFTCFSCILPCASLAGDVSRPRSGALEEYTIKLLPPYTAKSGLHVTPLLCATQLYRCDTQHFCGPRGVKNLHPLGVMYTCGAPCFRTKYRH